MQLDVQQFGAHVLEPLAGARMQPLRGVGSPYICTAVLTSGLWEFSSLIIYYIICMGLIVTICYAVESWSSFSSRDHQQ